MQKIATVCVFFLLLCQVPAWSQGVYIHKLILKNTPITETVNPGVSPEILDSAVHGVITFTFFTNDFWVNYTPDNNFTGTDTVVIKYKQDKGQGALILYKSFVFEMVNSYLELNNDFITVYSGQTNIEFNPLLNDSSSISGTNKMSLKALPAYNNLVGPISILNDSIIKFSTSASFSGAASITYRVCDTFGLCKDAFVNISVIDTNNIDLIDTISFYTPEDVGVQILLPDSGFSVNVNAKHGKVDIEEASFKYKPFGNFNGNDTFKLKKNNITRLILVTVIPQDEPNSIIVPDIVYTPVNTEITFDVSSNDVQALVGLYPIGLDKNVSKGTLTKLNNKGLFKYVPQTDYTGVQTFSYKVCPQGICEFAKVKIYVGDYEPNTDSIYSINTYRNTPILLSYQVPVNAYNFSATTDSVKFYPGWDTLNLTYNYTCTSELIGFNQLVYKPKLNFIGWDTFKINYCIAGTNNCVQAELLVHILYETKNCVKQCVGDCVWPGDVDMNGCVDMKDLLAMSCELGKTGKQRTFTDNNFRSHSGNDWGEYMMNTSLDIKHADCNGDSIINMEDTLAIYNSYKLTHSLIPNEVYSKGSFPIDFEILTQDIDSGDQVLIEVRIGDSQYPATNISGYTYNVDYNTKVVIENTLYVDYYEQGWFGRSATTLNMFQKPWDGRLESGFVRANASKVSGKGGTEVIVCIVEDDLQPFSDDSKVAYPFHFKNIKYQDANGELFSVEDKTVYLNMVKKQKNAPVVLNEKKLIVFPNPASDYVNIYMNGKNTISSYKLYSIEGKELLSNTKPDAKNNFISTQGLSNGIYILKVETPVGSITKKVEIMN